jgi:hypothetical protein
MIFKFLVVVAELSNRGNKISAEGQINNLAVTGPHIWTSNIMLAPISGRSRMVPGSDRSQSHLAHRTIMKIIDHTESGFGLSWISEHNKCTQKRSEQIVTENPSNKASNTRLQSESFLHQILVDASTGRMWRRQGSVNYTAGKHIHRISSKVHFKFFFAKSHFGDTTQ